MMMSEIEYTETEGDGEKEKRKQNGTRLKREKMESWSGCVGRALMHFTKRENAATSLGAVGLREVH